MAETKCPGASGNATGAELPCYAIAAGKPNIASGDGRGNALAHRLAPFAALDPATLTALWLLAARVWGAMQ